MNRKGNYCDTPVKNIWSTLKNERGHHQRYRTRAQAIQQITQRIEIFF
jgi:hypothetical protein